MPAAPRPEVDVVVVGAGLSGLVAARDLIAAGLDVVVMEASGRVGGRVRNEALPGAWDDDPHGVLEVGGQWLGPGQDRAYALAAELDLQTFPTYDDGARVLELRRGVRRRYSGSVPRLSPVVIADVAQAQARFDRLARRVPVEAPELANGARDLDAESVGSWLRRACVTRTGRELFGLAVQAVWAAEPREVSLLHALAYTAAAGGLDPLLDTRGGAQQDRVVGGTALLAERLAQRLGDRVVIDAPVRRVRWVPTADGPDRTAPASPSSVQIDADGDVTVRARHAVVAIPPSLAGRLVYAPALPPLRDSITARAPMGAVVKCFAVYDEPFWRADELSGQATSLVGPVGVTYDASPPGGRPGVLLGFLEGDAARAWSPRPAAERRQAVLDGFGRLFGRRARSPEHFVDQDWTTEEFVRGCYAGLLPPGAWTTGGAGALRRPVGPLHWAGTETASRWTGYLDGAVRAGERAAREVLAARAVDGATGVAA